MDLPPDTDKNLGLHRFNRLNDNVLAGQFDHQTLPAEHQRERHGLPVIGQMRLDDDRVVTHADPAQSEHRRQPRTAIGSGMRPADVERSF